MIKVGSINHIACRAIDGCQTGWVIAAVQDDSRFIVNYVSHLSEVKQDSDALNFIDIPIRLPQHINEYPRASDRLAKEILGRFHASIFYAPLVQWLDQSYSKINQHCLTENKPKISKQSFNLFKKIKEAQHEIKKRTDQWVEIHPELLVHYFLKDKKMSKKTLVGQMQRIDIINTVFKFNVTHDHIVEALKKIKANNSTASIQVDDLLDALFCAMCIYRMKNYNLITKSDILMSDELYNRFQLFK